jgi:hypothetical protein
MRATLVALLLVSGMSACAPVRLTPKLAAGSHAEAVESLWALVPGYGLVRGSEAGLAGLETPALDISDHPVAQACRATVDDRAQAYAPAHVDVIAASAPARSNNGASAPVTIRVIYRHRLTYEVRLASLICQIDQAGRFLDAIEVAEAQAGGSAHLPP